MSKADIEAAHNLYMRGLSLNAVARQYGTSPRTLAALWREAGLPYLDRYGQVVVPHQDRPLINAVALQIAAARRDGRRTLTIELEIG